MANPAEYYIGLMSGTSMDGVDAVLIDVSGYIPKFVAAHSERISADLKIQLITLCEEGPDEINRLGELDIIVGKLFADAVLHLLEKTNLKPEQIIAIGSHGQTIRHRPDVLRPFTLQIGDPNTIAAITGITTVADFRRRDIAFGGQGAPLAPAFHAQTLRDKTQDTIVLNIGGIANITVLPADEKQAIIGFDTGPGNVLLDAWCLLYHQQEIDKGGKWAAQGTFQESLLTELLADSYFLQAPPKSTGREYFNYEWLSHCIERTKQSYLPQDVQATIVELTAVTVVNAISQLTTMDKGRLLVCGGGVHNDYLMSRLHENCHDFTVMSTQEYDIDPDWVEAMCFAWLAQQTLQHQPGNIPSVTGASKATILGAVYYA